MPQDCPELRNEVLACLPSFVFEDVAQTSGQRVVYFGHFENRRIAKEVTHLFEFLVTWEGWGRVVLKVVAGALPADLTRLQAEVALLGELKSSRLPTLHYADYFPDNPITDSPLSQPLFVSIEEFIESVPLSQLLNAYVGKGADVCRLALEITEALRPLWEHKRRFVHRDIKPANILIRPNGSVVVIDLGIVRETGTPGITAVGWGKGPLTVDYAAPEQIANDKEAVGFRTDFFAIGVLMYQLLSGKHPFRTQPHMSDFDVATVTETVEPPSLSSIGAAEHLVSAVVEKMMQKQPHKRPRTVDELQGQLKSAGDQ